MLIFYTKSTCPFCHKVKNFFDDKGIEYDERDVYQNDEYMNELLEAGGKRQMPFLIDTERGEQMYESADIIDYVSEHYGEDPKDIIM